MKVVGPGHRTLFLDSSLKDWNDSNWNVRKHRSQQTHLLAVNMIQQFQSNSAKTSACFSGLVRSSRLQPYSVIHVQKGFWFLAQNRTAPRTVDERHFDVINNFSIPSIVWTSHHSTVMKIPQLNLITTGRYGTVIHFPSSPPNLLSHSELHTENKCKNASTVTCTDVNIEDGLDFWVRFNTYGFLFHLKVFHFLPALKRLHFLGLRFLWQRKFPAVYNSCWWPQVELLIGRKMIQTLG